MCVGEYQRKISKGDLSDAGASLEWLMQVVRRLSEMWDPNRARWHDPSVMADSEYPSSTEQTKKGTSARFLAVNFIIATQGVYPPRS
jgi:hypothetical protein